MAICYDSDSYADAVRNVSVSVKYLERKNLFERNLLERKVVRTIYSKELKTDNRKITLVGSIRCVL